MDNFGFATKITPKSCEFFCPDQDRSLYETAIRDITILGRQRDGDGQNKLLQINGSKDSSSYIINHMNLI
jgi:hypothetical protein